MKMVASIFTREKLTQQTTAEEVLNGMMQNGFEPDRMGFFEPLRQSFTEEGFLDLWRHEEPGCYKDEVGMIGTAGGCLVKFKNPNLLMSTSWWDCPNKESINVISFFFTKATFKNKQQQIENVFRHTVLATKGLHGYISEAPAVYRQGSGNMLHEKLPGIYWCNYFSEQVAEVLGKKNLAAYDWWEAEADVQNGLYLYTDESPFDNWVQNDVREMQVKWQLGINFFEEAEDLEVYVVDEE